MLNLRSCLLLLPLLMAVPGSDAHAWGKKKEKKESKGMMMPDLNQVLGNAYEAPPELTSRATPGAIIRLTAERVKVFKSGCVAGQPDKHQVTSIKMQSQLSGGVRFNVGVGSITGEAASSLELNFQSPFIQSYEESAFELTPECTALLKKTARTTPMNDLVVVEEVMMAKISGCTKFDTALDGQFAGRGGSASVGGRCEMISDEPVVIGFRTQPVTDLVPGLAAGRAPVTVPSSPGRPVPQAAVPKRVQSPAAVGVGPAARLSAGTSHSCGVAQSGRVKCWGDNKYGQSTPPSDLFVSVSAGASFTCGLTRSGTVKCWGRNSEGQSSPPKGLYRSISAGNMFGTFTEHACGVLQSGTVKCWGENGYGKSNPRSGLFKSVSAGGVHTCGLTNASRAKCWGQGAVPILWRLFPREGAGAKRAPSGVFLSLSAGFNHSCGVRPSGAVKCWGSNMFNESTPPSALFESVSVGFRHSCGVTQSGKVTCWGKSRWSKALDQSTPPPDLFVSVSAGQYHNCGLTQVGTVKCWGDNEYGQSTPPADLRIATD